MRPRHHRHRIWIWSEAGLRVPPGNRSTSPASVPGQVTPQGTFAPQDRTHDLDGDSNTTMNRPLAAGWAPGIRGPDLFLPIAPGCPGVAPDKAPEHPCGLPGERRRQEAEARDSRHKNPPADRSLPGGAGSKGRAACPSSFLPGQPCPVRADGVTRIQEKLLAGSLHTFGSEACRPRWQPVDLAPARSGLLLCRGWDNRPRPTVLPGSGQVRSSSVPNRHRTHCCHRCL